MKKKILFLSSVYPNFNHYTASSTVLANLLKESYLKKYNTDLYILNDHTVKKNLKFNLKNKISIKKYNLKKSNFFSYLRKVFLLIFKFDLNIIYFNGEYKSLSKKIINNNYYLIILFWDTEFEYLLPYLKNQKIITYAALPKFYSSIKRNENFYGLNLKRNYFYFLKIKYYKIELKKHFNRLKNIKIHTNICNQTKKIYNKISKKSFYVQNCWPDFYLNLKKKKISNKKTNILANIGGLNSTGNYFGIKYLIKVLFPLINRDKKQNYLFNIYGRYKLPKSFEIINNELYFKNHGFVKNIDNEIMKNDLCLVLNNAYKKSLVAGYTRIIYFFSFKKCVIAHKRLKKSMPELKHNYNCLLGKNAKEIKNLIKKASNSESLRNRIGKNARLTYLSKYTPEKVFLRILRIRRKYL